MSTKLSLPVLPLDDTVVLPTMVVPLDISSSEARASIEAAQMSAEAPLGSEKGPQVLLVPRLGGKYAPVGTLAAVEQVGRLPSGEQAAVVRGLKLFHHRGSDVLVFHILDPDEIDFPFDRATRFEDLETSEEVMAVPGVVREHYLKAITSLVERYRRELGGAGIDYQLLNTKEPLELGLMKYLSTRARG